MAAPATRWYRRPPGAGWLAALIVVPLGIGVIGWTGAESAGPEQALPNASVTLTPADLAAPDEMLAPFSLRRKADDVVLSGQLPDQASVAFALDLARTQLPGTTVLDMLTPIAGVTAADLTGLDAVLAAGAPLSDFGFSIEGGEVVLFGTAQTDAAKLELEEAVRAAWPDLEVLNDIAVLSAPPVVPPAPR
ncbi:channel-forming protein ArfA/OmpATb [Mycobacterium sp. NPDC003323]